MLVLSLAASSVQLLNSLSLQTIALYARQRSIHALATAKVRDAEHSVEMAFQQHAAGAHACLLALPPRSGQPLTTVQGPIPQRSNPVALRIAIGSCWIGNPTSLWLEFFSCVGVMAVKPVGTRVAAITFTEVVVSALILGISSQVSFQGWSRTNQAVATSFRTDQQVRLLEQRLLASRCALASAQLANADCHWDREAVVGVLEGLPEDVAHTTSWRYEPSGNGIWLAVELTNPAAAIPFKRSQLLTPAGMGHCPHEGNDEP